MDKKISKNVELLKVIDLKTSFFTGESHLRAVDGVSFSIRKGEIFGIVGESGSGKTVTSLSILRLVQPPGKIVGGNIFFEGRDLLGLTDLEMEEVRGSRIGMVFQEPMTALNPVFRIGEQIAETIAIHQKDFSHTQIYERTLELLTQVGFDEPEKKYLQYPHQLSGGQRQRVLIASAISCNPSLVIADEPTTALDVATESQIIGLLEGLVSRYGMSMIFITHNLNIMKRLGDRIGIMYAGRVLEDNSVKAFFEKPLHPYGRGLLESIDGLSGNAKRLAAIPGYVPKLSEMPEGCKFHPRCPHVMPICRTLEPVMKEIGRDQWVRCYLYQN
jgi:peptide/nickel transport system ATP-binding protein